MTPELYHQAGHNYSWNLQSLTDDGAGDGIILAPRYMPLGYVRSLPADVRVSAIFDPQFFRPGIALGKLAQYPFFPENAADPFTTATYPESEASSISAESCVAFQMDLAFRYIVIPTRCLEATPADFVERQSEQFVEPFLEAIRRITPTQPILLQLILNEHMIRETEFAADILNWVTGIPEIQGIYLIVERSGSSKQISNAELLLDEMRFISSLRHNDMDVVLGYLNTEAILLSLADPTIVTMGAYEKTRMFRARHFEEPEEQKGGPEARIYVSRLLQWISNGYKGPVIEYAPGGEGFFDQTPYQVLMFDPTFQWHFTKPALYKHHFLVMARQIREIGALTGIARYAHVRALIEEAIQRYRYLEAAGIVFEDGSGGGHLAPWLTAANLFAADQGWR